MSAFYDRMASTARSMIERFGRDISISRPVEGTFDAASGVVTPGTANDGTLKGVVLPANTSSKDLFDNLVEDGTMIGKQIRYVVAAAKGAPFEPESNDILSFDSASWRIVGCTPLSPDGTPLIYKIGAVRV